MKIVVDKQLVDSAEAYIKSAKKLIEAYNGPWLAQGELVRALECLEQSKED